MANEGMVMIVWLIGAGRVPWCCLMLSWPGRRNRTTCGAAVQRCLIGLALGGPRAGGSAMQRQQRPHLSSCRPLRQCACCSAGGSGREGDLRCSRWTIAGDGGCGVWRRTKGMRGLVRFTDDSLLMFSSMASHRLLSIAPWNVARRINRLIPSRRFSQPPCDFGRNATR